MSNKLKCSVSMERSQNARGEAGYLVDVRVWVTGGEQKRQRLFCRGSRADATVFGNEMQNQLSEALLGASAPRIPTYGVPPSAIGAPPLVPPRPQPPRVRDFVPVFLRDYMRANKRAESTVDSYEYRLRLYVVPALGNLRLNELGRPALTKLKASLSTLSAGSVNDVLAVLSKMLDFAVGQELLPAMPYRLKDVKLQETVGTPDFYDFEEFERLVKAAYNLGPVEYATVLLGGEAGLRRGEIAALQWPQVDLKSGRLTVSWSLYKKTLGPPKGRRSRTLQMTDRLRGALTALSSRFTGDRVLLARGAPFTVAQVNEVLGRASKAAGLQKKGGRKVHILRHTFCSHLAMRGATAVQIQALAGHVDLKTTQLYMHLSPGHADEAIALLNDRAVPEKLAGKLVPFQLPNQSEVTG